MYKKHEDEESRYRAKRHDSKMDSVLLLCLHLFRRPKCLVMFYRCDAPFSERRQEDLDAQQLCIKYVNRLVNDTTARRVPNDRNRQKVDDTEATVSVPFRNDVRLYQPMTLKTKRDLE